mgnify:CR=1 FL=1
MLENRIELTRKPFHRPKEVLYGQVDLTVKFPFCHHSASPAGPSSHHRITTTLLEEFGVNSSGTFTITCAGQLPAVLGRETSSNVAGWRAGEAMVGYGMKAALRGCG